MRATICISLGVRRSRTRAADGVDGLHGGDVGALDDTLAASHAADAIDEGGSGDAAADYAVEQVGECVGDLARLFSATRMTRPSSAWAWASDGGRGRRRGWSREQDEAPRSRRRQLAEAGQVVALGHDAHVVFERQDACGSGAKDRLVIGENKSIHESYLLRG